jgi:hypothetical protein
MTTIIVQLPPGLAREFARIADTESMPHEDLARVALRLFVKAVKADERTNQPTNQPTNQRKTQAAPSGGESPSMNSCDLLWREDPLPYGART